MVKLFGVKSITEGVWPGTVKRLDVYDGELLADWKELCKVEMDESAEI